MTHHSLLTFTRLILINHVGRQEPSIEGGVLSQVLHRVRQPIKQIRKGLKETGIWPPVSNRPDVHPILFPREKNDELNSQTVIQNIHWLQPKSDSDEDEDDAVPLEKVSLVTGFLRQFIEEASPKVLRDLSL
ncbi:hypothetical protein NQZ68_001011 [Dissostichus eleginoides]|nr:hypothetical protein NQZ68_001011 [Dissostichus eleginoides]